jgi:hypothetical protein
LFHESEITRKKKTKENQKLGLSSLSSNMFPANPCPPALQMLRLIGDCQQEAESFDGVSSGGQQDLT